MYNKRQYRRMGMEPAMGIFGKIFGKGKDAAAAVDPRQDPNLMQFFDEYGREIFFTREQWRKDILPGNIKNAWNDADALSGLIVSALNDGFAAEVLAAGEQLYRLEGDKLEIIGELTLNT
jgi:hypothetical protein